MCFFLLSIFFILVFFSTYLSVPCCFLPRCLFNLSSDLPYCFLLKSTILFFLFLLRYSVCFSLLFYYYSICSLSVILHLFWVQTPLAPLDVCLGLGTKPSWRSSWWPSGRNVKTTVISIRLVRLPPQEWSIVGRETAKQQLKRLVWLGARSIVFLHPLLL